MKWGFDRNNHNDVRLFAIAAEKLLASNELFVSA
jgi:hypothetical protein